VLRLNTNPQNQTLFVAGIFAVPELLTFTALCAAAARPTTDDIIVDQCGRVIVSNNTM